MLSCVARPPILLSNEARQFLPVRKLTESESVCCGFRCIVTTTVCERFTSRKKLCKRGDNSDHIFFINFFFSLFSLARSSFLLVHSFDVIGVGESTLFVRVHRVPLLAVQFLPALLHAVR
jgi:hypothetical protein